MTTPRDSLRRLLSSDERARRAMTRRLQRERPRADARFEARLRQSLAMRWATASRPPGLRLRAIAFVVAGVVLLAVALVIAAS